MRSAGLVILLFLSTAAAGQSVVDGDTLKASGITYRLWGIDAPEKAQWCGDYPAGDRAAAALTGLVEGRPVACEARAVNRYGRTVALCRAAGMDLGAAMVQLGQAWAFVRYSRDYIHDESLAREKRVGVWGHDCGAPWDWRAARR